MAVSLQLSTLDGAARVLPRALGSAGGGESWRQRSAVAVDNAASAAAAAAAAANTRWNANLLAIATATARPTRGIRRQTTSE